MIAALIGGGARDDKPATSRSSGDARARLTRAAPSANPRPGMRATADGQARSAAGRDRLRVAALLLAALLPVVAIASALVVYVARDERRAADARTRHRARDARLVRIARDAAAKPLVDAATARRRAIVDAAVARAATVRQRRSTPPTSR